MPAEAAGPAKSPMGLRKAGLGDRGSAGMFAVAPFSLWVSCRPAGLSLQREFRVSLYRIPVTSWLLTLKGHQWNDVHVKTYFRDHPCSKLRIGKETQLPEAQCTAPSSAHAHCWPLRSQARGKPTPERQHGLELQEALVSQPQPGAAVSWLPLSQPHANQLLLSISPKAK